MFVGDLSPTQRKIERRVPPLDSFHVESVPNTSALVQSATEMSVTPQSHALTLKKRLRPFSGLLPQSGLLVPKPTRGKDSKRHSRESLSLEQSSAKKTGLLPGEPVPGLLRTSSEKSFWQTISRCLSQLLLSHMQPQESA